MKVCHLLPRALALVSFGWAAWAANEIGFVEKFVLAPDREAVLAQLVPGTEEYYFFHALHYQTTGQRAKWAPLMEAWANRFPASEQRRVLENREALLAYDSDPQRTLTYLREKLGVPLTHSAVLPDRKPDLPTQLDPTRVTPAIFRGHLMGSDDLAGASEEVLQGLVREQVALRPSQRRALLSRLEWPAVPGLVELIATDLKTQESRGLGEFGIHRKLLVDQLDRLRELVPALAVQEAYVHERIRRLAPGADADGEYDPVEREAWLGRLWEYVKTLPPTFNTLKAHVLHGRLQFDRTRGVRDRARFIEYLKLPRPLPYVSPRMLQESDGGRFPVDVNAGFEGLGLGLPPVGLDEALVRDYLLGFAADDATWESWAEWVRDTWVKPVFAEAKITAGRGDPEQWASLLSPAAYQALRDRVDIELSPTNPAFTDPASDVSVKVTLKNTPKLLVKLYEINTPGFFLGQQRQLNTDVQLDGLVANAEQSHDGDASPFRRVERTFSFPTLKGRRGAWIIEFIGGGRSSRALVRKGQFSVVQRTGSAGVELEVQDEGHRVVTNAVAWLDGRQWAMDPKTGRIRLPFTATPGRRPVVISDVEGTFASLSEFEHEGENYTLDARMHVEREQLLAGRDAVVGIRPVLRLNGEPVAPGLLEEVRLRLVSTTHDGVVTTLETRDPKLTSAGVFTQSLRVPERLARLVVTFDAKVASLTAGGEKKALSASNTWNVNETETSMSVRAGHFIRLPGGHVYEVLGRNGEPMPDQAVEFVFSRAGHAHEEVVGLRTGLDGRIALGTLEGVSRVLARLPGAPQSELWPATMRRLRSSSLHARVGDPVLVPWDGPMDAGAVSLLEWRGGQPFADRTGSVVARDGYLVMGALGVGDYRLRLVEQGVGHEMAVRVSGTNAVGRWIVGDNRLLESSGPVSVQVRSIAVDGGDLVLKLAHWHSLTRVHVSASRHEPRQDLFAALQSGPVRGPRTMIPGRLPNLYSGGREIGDEYRYILDRRYAAKYPGNMLPRPGLLLNPWEKRSTEQNALLAKSGAAAMAMAGDRMASLAAELDVAKMEKRSAEAGDANIDYLATASPVLFNLEPDAEGVVRIPLASLGDRHCVRWMVESGMEAVSGAWILPEKPVRFRDLRLARNLDPAQPAMESREVERVLSGTVLTMSGSGSDELEVYDTLASVHGLFASLKPDPTLAQFEWMVRWPRLTDAEKQARYSEFACHELNLFLARKDPAFFERVVKPSLANKREKTFLDDYLLGRDLRRYLEPWAHGRLNVAERALLGRRVEGEGTNTLRHLRELWELRPLDPERVALFFETALRGRELETVSDSPSRRLMETFGKPGEAGNRFGMPPGSVVDAMAVPPPPMAAGTAGAPGASLMGRRDTDAKDKASRLAWRERANGRAGGGGFGGGETLELRKEALSAAKPGYFDAMDEQLGRGLRRGTALQAYYRPLGPTREWAENHYYRLPMEQQGPGLVTINGFWRDYAAWDGRTPFLSTNVAEAARSFAEMALALAVLDLPFEAPKHVTRVENGQFSFTAGGPAIVFRKQLKAIPAADTGGVLVSESFFREDDRYRVEGNEKFDRFVTEEFQAGVVYGAQVVVGNPGSSPVKLDLLTQIPRGALPVGGSRATLGQFVRLDPYGTRRFEYRFYFPEAATNGAVLPHFPAHAAVAAKSAGGARPFSFRVVRQLSRTDTQSWEYVSQQGTEAQVFEFLAKNGLAGLDLEKIAWRSRQGAEFHRRLLDVLSARHAWSEPNWRYALVHNHAAGVREWLRHRDDFMGQCGAWFSNSLVRIDPVERRVFEHLDYSPLVNQRVHRFGAERPIPNPVLREQYRRLLDILACKPALDGADQLAVVYFLFLQDRVEEALARFKAIPADSVETRIQHDYMRCYADFYEGRLDEARTVATRYAGHPVDRWRLLFAEVLAQLDEVVGKKGVRPGETPDRERRQAELAAAEPTFDFKLENRSIEVTARNLGSITVNYYLMDPEFLFSSSPFVASDPARFSIIKPTFTSEHRIPAGKDRLGVPLPERFAQANVLVEVVGGGRRKTQAHHSGTFRLDVSENYGRIELRDATGAKPVSKAYVKVYARLAGGAVRFLKDGYTDLRGRFDYASINESRASGGEPVAGPAGGGMDYPTMTSAELDRVEKIALLVLSETEGAAVREVDPPRR